MIIHVYVEYINKCDNTVIEIAENDENYAELCGNFMNFLTDLYNSITSVCYDYNNNKFVKKITR